MPLSKKGKEFDYHLAEYKRWGERTVGVINSICYNVFDRVSTNSKLFVQENSLKENKIVFPQKVHTFSSMDH